MEYKVNKATLDEIAEAIKEKSHKTGKIKLTGDQGFAESILAIPQSGEGADVQLTERLDGSYDVNIIDDGSHVTIFQEGHANPDTTEQTYYPEEGYAGFSSFTVGPGGSGGGGAGIKFELSGTSFDDAVFNDLNMMDVIMNLVSQAIEQQLFGPDFDYFSEAVLMTLLANTDIELYVTSQGIPLKFRSCGTANFSSYRVTSGDLIIAMADIEGWLNLIDPFSIENEEGGTYFQLEMPSMNMFGAEDAGWGPINVHACQVIKTKEETDDGDIYTWTAQETVPSELITSMMAASPVKFLISVSDKGYRPFDNFGGGEE